MEDFRESSEVIVWGSSAYGQLAYEADETQRLPTPRLHTFPFPVRAVACGDEHALLLTETSLVYALGSNSDGRLGVGELAVRSTKAPLLVKELTRVASVACGAGHSLAATTEGQAYAWGKGDSGALGLSSVESCSSPQLLNLPSSLRVRQVSCGARHSAVLAVTSVSKGTLLTFGCGGVGQLGSPLRLSVTPATIPTEDEVKQVSCGVVHTCFVTYSGKLFATGGNSLGQLGTGNKSNARTPIRVKALDGVFIEKVACGNHTAALSDKGDVYLWGTGAFGEKLLPWKPAVPVPFRDIDMGGCFGAALDVSKRLWTWGTNAEGELGQSDFKQRKVPTLVEVVSRRAVAAFACGCNFVIAVARRGKSRDRSPMTRLNLPVVRPRPASDFLTPKSVKTSVFESPLSLKLRTPSEFVFSPKRESETIPETMETETNDDRRSGVIRHIGRLTEGLACRPRLSDEGKSDCQIEADRSSEVLSLRERLLAAENSREALSARISILEREIELGRDKESRSDYQQSKLRSENAELVRKLAEKDDELSVATAARQNMQLAYDRLNENSQKLIADLRSERQANERLSARVSELEREQQRAFSSPKVVPPGQFLRRGDPSPRVSGGVSLLSQARIKKSRTIRPLDAATPQSQREDDINLRLNESQERPEFTQSVTSLTDASQDLSVPAKSSPNSPETKSNKREDSKPRLRNNVSDLKIKLKALRDNQPVLESKISAFERRLRGSLDRRQ